jgi:hypothetical protein
MAKFRAVHMAFWRDTKVENFSSDEKYLFLYFLTNEYTNLCGCYEISIRKIASETGLSEDKTAKVIDSLQAQKVIAYSKDTAEVLIVNWYYYNWTTSTQFRKPLGAEIERVKDASFREYLTNLYEYGDAELNIDSPVIAEVKPKKPVKDKPEKHKYGTDGKILLTDEEYSKLCEEYGQGTADSAIEYLASYKAEKGYTSKSDYLTIRRWVIDAVNKRKPKTTDNTTSINEYLMQQAIGG